VTTEPPRLRLEMPFLLMVGMVVSAFMGFVGVCAGLLQAAGAFSSTQLFGQPAAPGLKGALENGTFVAHIFWLLLAAVAWGLWREQWWTRPVMVGFWALMVTVAAVQYARGLALAWSGCFPVIGLALSAAYLYGKGNVTAYFRILESRAFPREKPAERGSSGAA
jgi:hypothetical protein